MTTCWYTKERGIRDLKFRLVAGTTCPFWALVTRRIFGRKEKFVQLLQVRLIVQGILLENSLLISSKLFRILNYQTVDFVIRLYIIMGLKFVQYV